HPDRLFAADPVRAWVTRPVGTTEPLPVVGEFLGYNGGRGLPGERVSWALAGYVHRRLTGRDVLGVGLQSGSLGPHSLRSARCGEPEWTDREA
ncbi:acetylxylan esterase, partial [Bacillus sp. S34]|nr:acetylxylan esterase [Bacillus sp. S34]